MDDYNIGLIILGVIMAVAVISTVIVVIRASVSKKTLPPPTESKLPLPPTPPIPPVAPLNGESLYLFREKSGKRKCSCCDCENDLGAACCEVCGEPL